MIDKPVPGVKTDARPHPPGKKGAMISLQEVADRAWSARMSPRLRAWVLNELDKCGVSRGSRREKAACVLKAFRAKVPYVHDPVMGEFMATPDQLLCLDDASGICMKGSDCDEMSLSLAAAMMSIGIPAQIVGSSHHDPEDTPTHVFMAFEDDLGDWVKMDGTTDLPVGKVPAYIKTFWVEPGAKAQEEGQGDFVGMSALAGASGQRLPTSIELRYPWLR